MAKASRIKDLYEQYIRKNEDITPLPWAMLLILTTLCILNDVNVTMLFSFAPKLIKTTFGYSELETGYYTGLLSSFFYIGMLLCSFFWGYLGDKYGKKCSIITSTIGHTLATLAFGFSNTYICASLARFIQGCFFGVIFMSKSMLHEYLDDTNRTYGMTILTSSGVIGYILGPSYAGFLVFPCEQYPSLFARVQIFEMFPILLPYIILVCVFIVLIVLSFVYLPDDVHCGRKYSSIKQTETNSDWTTGARNIAEESSGEIQTKTHSNTNVASNAEEGILESMNDFEKEKQVRSQTSLHSFVPSQDDSDGETLTKIHQYKGTKSTLFRFDLKKHISKLKIAQIVRNSDSLISCSLYGLYGFASIGSNELFPLYASTSRLYRGLELNTSQIGTILLSGCIVLLFVQVPLIQRITIRLKAKKTFIYSACIQGVLTVFIPIVGLIPRDSLITVLSIYMLLLRFWVSVSFLSITILINNSVDLKLNAIANSFGFTLSAVGRLISPSIFGALFAWSLTNVRNTSNAHALGFPFNHFFSFIVLSVVLFIIGFLATKLSSKVD